MALATGKWVKNAVTELEKYNRPWNGIVCRGRRSFAYSILPMKNSVFAFVILLGMGSAQAQKKVFPQTPGMVSYTYRNSFQKNVAATLDTIKAYGITDMEFSNLFGKTAADLRKLLDERRMKCSSFGVGYPDLQNKLAEVGQNAKTLGAQFVRVAWIPHQGPFTLDMAKKTVDDFNRFGKQLKDEYGLTFCYHNHGYEFETYEDGTLFDYIVKNTDPTYVSFELDILWTVFPGHDPVALLNKYPKRFKLMHLKDLRKGIVGNLSGGTPVENDVALGTGQIDLPAVLTAAQKSGVQHFYIEDESPSIATQVPQSIAYLKDLKK
ncbi:sugar phosphate isomerase/epimerase [Spirosoma aerophilum]